MLSRAVTDPAHCLTDVLHIFSTYKQVDTHNSAMLTKLGCDISTIDAEDDKKDSRTGKMSRQAQPFKGDRIDLPDMLQVAEGAQVILTQNLEG